MRVFKRWSLFLLGLVLVACVANLANIRRNYYNYNELVADQAAHTETPYLKAHYKNGDVVVFSNAWKVNAQTREIVGTGVRYNYDRLPLAGAVHAVSVDSLALIETNDDLQQKDKRILAPIAVLTGVNLTLTAFCAANPKACFGSCPTFYFETDPANVHYSRAEGFSNAILPRYEYTDIDALGTATTDASGKFALVMKNEALETHCIREATLLAAPKSSYRVLHGTDDQFYYAGSGMQPNTVWNATEEKALNNFLVDGKEYLAPADANNLNTKEELILDFADLEPNQAYGFEIKFRQGFLTTYLIYSALGYMGNNFSDYLAEIENAPDAKTRFKNGIKKVLGDIEVYSWNESERDWQLQGGFNETGPIAINHQVLPLSLPSNRIKLRYNKGLWKFQELALVPLQGNAAPVRVAPSVVNLEGQASDSLTSLLQQKDQLLVSMPGNAFTLQYQLPAKHTEYELFLEGTGYYLEWMRDEWIAEESAWKLLQLSYFPELYLRSEAAAYKSYETTMEQQFWNSRLNTENIAYYE